uniref:BGAL3 n=1 Tax=Arundo donax TaxID=35708 RepID=A0A0A9GG76_ARUDO
MRASGKIYALESPKHLPSKQTVLSELSLLCIPGSTLTNVLIRVVPQPGAILPYSKFKAVVFVTNHTMSTWN